MRTMVAISILLGAALGLAIGIGGFTFSYARGYSYLLNDPAACANCHVMDAHFSAWRHSSHRAVATCNDCHLPAGLAGGYVTKARNGLAHGVAFTTGDHPWPLKVKPHNQQVAEANCRRCHQQIVHQIEALADEPMRCTRCHAGVGHATR